MKLSIANKVPAVDVILIALYEKEKLSADARKLIGTNFAKQADERIKAKDFDGSEGQTLILFDKKQKFTMIGRGKKDKQMPNASEMLGGTMAGLAKKLRAKKAALILDGKDLLQIANGFILGDYEFKHYKKEDAKAPKIVEVTFVTDKNKENLEILKTLNSFQESSALVRTLINIIPSELDPKGFVTESEKVVKNRALTLTVFDEKKLKTMGCGGLIGVGQGAKVGPRMIILEYKNKAKSKNADIVFVGKGVTFDTGGLNLKPSGHIETMKQDMAGAATVLGAMQAIADQKLKGHFVGILVCAENALSDKSVHPGDILQMYNGKTVEVLNTDAEGRLILADGLAYAEKQFKPKMMVNIATLTGAVSVALGYKISGVMGNNKKTTAKILKTAESVDERMWELPLDADFVKATEGNISDLKNISDGMRAGSTMGGAFLSNFVEKTPWAHIDIGGTAWADKPTPTTKYGSTSAGLRTLIELAKTA